MTPLNSEKIGRLRRAMEWSRKRLEPFRGDRLELLENYVGTHYGEQAKGRPPVPLPFISLAATIYARNLAARVPHVKVKPQNHAQTLEPFCQRYEMGMNWLIDEIKLQKTLREFVLNAIFSMGIIKTGIELLDTDVEVDGFTHDITQPFADVVGMDDWVHDMAAHRWDQISYAGHRYRLPLEFVKKSKLYDESKTKDLKATARGDSQEGSGEKARDLTQGDSEPVDFEEHVELWDLWLPKQNLVITLPEGGGETIRQVAYYGPEAGPYTCLSFMDVPDNIMPLAPAALWLDIHTLANEIFNKCGEDALRYKSILAVQGGAMEDGKRIQQAANGEIIRVDNAGGSKETTFGGIDQRSLAFVLQLDQMHSRFAGNLDAMGGLGPQSETLGQDELISAASSRQVADMQDRTVSQTIQVVNNLGWYLFYDPHIQLPSIRRDPGTGYTTDVSAVEREGDYLDYNITIEPYSMTHQTPSTRLQALRQVLAEVITPMQPFMQEQGISVNVEGILRKFGEYLDMKDLEQIVMFMPSAAGSQGTGPVGTPPNKPPFTRRENVRINRPGASTAGKQQAMISSLLGAKVQGAEQAATLRPTG